MAKKSKKVSASVESRRRNRSTKIPLVKKNPFEVRLNRLKHGVIGKKVKTDKGLPGVARSKANEKRKKTLLKEYKQRFKTNVIIDKRFGEFDDSLTAEEKMLKRFTLEKQRHHEKSGLYNMEEDDEELTHFGQSLADIESFDDAGLKLTDDEDEVGDLDDHFGGFLTKKRFQDDNVPERKLTKQEIMDQVVANSKKKKYERQQTQEHAFEITQQLDTQWKEIQSMLVKRDDRRNTKLSKPDDYDKTVNELIFEAKGKATDRLKTEEEIAQEEKKRLEELEKQRRLRMLGITEDEEVYYQSADAIVESKKSKEDDRYEVRYHDGKMVMPEGISDFGELLRGQEEEDEDEDDDSEEGFDGGQSDHASDSGEENEEDEEEESDHEDLFSDEEDSLSDEVEETKKLKKIVEHSKNEKKTDKKKKSKKPTKDELPFVFKAPDTLEEFLKMTKDRKDEDILLALNRIRKCHHVKLEKANIDKMKVLFLILLEYIDHLCKSQKPPLKFINTLAEFIQQLVEDIPGHAKKILQTKLKTVLKQVMLRFKIKGDSGMFPTLKELVLFKVIAVIYPTSDLNHVVTTPCLFLMSMILNKGHCMNIKDVISGLFLLNIVHDYVKLSKRYLPEVITFLGKLFYLAAPVKTPLTKISASILNLRKNEKNILLVERTVAEEPININISSSLSPSCENLDSDLMRISCLKNSLLLAKKFCSLYEYLDTFHEIFEPCACLLQRLPLKKYPKTLQDLHADVLSIMKSKSSCEKISLTLQSRKPVPLPLLDPQFDENYEMRSKRRASDKTQNEREKLQYKLKKETKGAMREIRKDAHFLAKEQLKETLERDAGRRQKVKALQRALENERREIREMEKGK
ncbi:nucleolar protein 14-like [Hydractinia symbiolongicarpus]|uniref:nucleolar protein 14-like n=1 Tax=Hydractinia symbiolongicarpus TaxID=13093 RepID=UPI0025507467|nr:nucleolar protein 14-like [Hydractinia symbiolongicarpus]